MPAVSSSQKHLFSMVKGFKSGALKLSSLPSSLAKKVKKISGGISKKSASHFASTSAKGLPKHVAKEMFDFPALTFKEYIVLESEIMEEFNELPIEEQNKIIEACMEDEESKKGKKPKWLEKKEVDAEEKEGKKVSKAEKEKVGEEKEKKEVKEKWEEPYKVPESKKGMFKDKGKAELESELAKLRASGPHKKGSKEYTKEKEINFALRAKKGWS